MAEEKAVQVRVTGRVQGVNFRAWTQGEARKLGLAGWVRNEADGSVAAFLFGPGDAVDSMIERLHVGPPAAQVADVEVEDAQPHARPTDFAITG
jgi:acylphosphatase